MKKIKLALIATAGFLFCACGSKSEVDFSIIPVKSSGAEYQYIDVAKKGKIIINPQFGESYIFRDGLALVKTSGKDGKYGYIDKKGKFVVPPVYSVAQNFSEGVAWVQMDNQAPMLIDKKGKTIFQSDSMTKAYPFYGGLALAESFTSQGEKSFEFIDKKGKSSVNIQAGTFKSFITDDVYAFAPETKEAQKWGYKNKSGTMVIGAQFDYAHSFINGMAIVKTGDKYGVINKKGEYLINPHYDELEYDSDKLFIATINKKKGWINSKGDVTINPQYDNAYPFFGNKLAPVKMGSKWGYVSKKGEIEINPQFEFAESYINDYALVKNSGKYGFIDTKGEFIVHPLYDGIGSDFYVTLKQHSQGIPAVNSTEFKSYESLKEKITAYETAKAEREKAEAEARLQEQLLTIDTDPSPATAELEREAKKWQAGFGNNGSNSYKSNEGGFFSYKAWSKKNQWGGTDHWWSATSKMKIGGCPEKSAISLTKSYFGNYNPDGKNSVPAKCKAIAPKVISSHYYYEEGT
ncbi:MAG: WG repeat-containing protein [Fibromonadales bacterium]|nr:WG repeat-containing protein [Fibromonadales bacterium]